MFEELFANLNLKFRNLKLIQTAFTHRSYLNEVKSSGPSNERLEFLGDAILSFIISSHLYKVRPKAPEGDLTNLRSYIVKTESLAKVARDLNLGSYLQLSKGEELGGGRENTQLLANTFEALLGAIYIDQGLEAAKKVVQEILIPAVAVEIEKGPPKDSKSYLQEIVQNKEKKSPFYKILRTTGPDHSKRFLVGVYVGGQEVATGYGSSKQAAEEEAAKKALRKFRS